MTNPLDLEKVTPSASGAEHPKGWAPSELTFLGTFCAWYKTESSTDPAAEDKVAAFCTELAEKVPAVAENLEILDKVFSTLRARFEAADNSVHTVYLELSPWGAAYRALKEKVAAPPALVRSETSARSVILVSSESWHLSHVGPEKVIENLRETHTTREGRASPPPEGLGDRWKWDQREKPPSNFRPVPAWNVCDELVKIAVRRNDQEGVDVNRWSVWEQRENPITVAIRIREAVLYCQQHSPSERQMKLIFETISSMVQWDWSEAGAERSSSAAENLAHVPVEHRTGLILELLNGFDIYATLGEQIFMTHRTLAQLGFGVTWNDICYLAFATSRGVDADKSVAIKRVMGIIYSDKPRTFSDSSREVGRAVHRVKPGQVLWPSHWSRTSEEYHLYFVNRHRVRANEASVLPPFKRQKVRHSHSPRFSDGPSDDRGQDPPKEDRHGLGRGGSHPSRFGKSEKRKQVSGQERPKASGPSTRTRGV